MPKTASIVAALAPFSLAYVRLPFSKDAAIEHRAYDPRRQASNAVNIPMSGSPGDSTPNHFNVSFGTPPQPMLWGIDTGSHLASISGHDPTSCNTANCFDTTTSSTWVAQEGKCGENFIGGGIDESKTQNSTDTLTIGGATVDNYPVCINSAGTGGGKLGLNFDKSAYPDVLRKLRDGHIDRAAIALWFGDRQDQNSEITFGGVDATKYDGGLVQMILQSEPDGTYGNLRAPFTGFGLTDAQGTSHSLVPEGYPGRAPALDSGDGGISLPVDMYNALWAALGVVNSTSTLYKTVPCDLANSPATLDFTFGNSLTFQTPMSTWIGGKFDEPIILANGTAIPACRLNIDADEGDNGLLGMPLQQFIYIVWDYETKQVALGKARQGAISNVPAITPIASGTDIPGVTLTATATGVVVTTNSGKTIQTDPQVTTAVSGTTGLVYSTPLYNLGVDNTALSPTSSIPTAPLNTGVPLNTGAPQADSSDHVVTMLSDPTTSSSAAYRNVTSTPPPPSPPSTSTPVPPPSTSLPPYAGGSSSDAGSSGSGSGSGSGPYGSGWGGESGSSGSPWRPSDSYGAGSGYQPGTSGPTCDCLQIADLELRVAFLERFLL